MKGQATEAVAQAGVAGLAWASPSDEGSAAARVDGVWAAPLPLGGAFFLVSGMKLPRGVIALIDLSG